MFRNRLKAGLYVMSIIWTVWLIIKSYNSVCFSIIDGYLTVFVLLSSMIINDLSKSEKKRKNKYYDTK
ncbi:hypothetical protein HOC35_02675 [Candidatus Woesearchaeota archaeon]|jgi:hypothetical protein|nr:hypothetical protein [Candidatus Woesearchaeota archaeon]